MFFLGVPLCEPEFFKPNSTWLQHGPFGLWLVHALQPRQIVELGTQHGFSYFCFCQAVAGNNLPTQCFAVDPWQDDGCEAYHDEDVYFGVESENQPYAKFSTLLRKSFAEALDQFADGSVDLLHIDGRHSYADVKEIFESWVPKLSARAVVLFHGTEVRDGDFGVWQYWAEIAPTRPSVNFPYQNGLGLLFLGEEIADGLAPLLQLLAAAQGRTAVVESFAAAGEGFVRDVAHRTTLNALESEVSTLSRELALAKATAAASKGDIAFLQSLLLDARLRPLKQLKHNQLFKLLRALAKASPSQRRAERFHNSAAKRDPERDDLQQRPGGKSNITYATVLNGWAKQRQALTGKLHDLAQRLQNGPLISVVVPVYNPDPTLLVKMIESVRAQSYANWELCLADDCSPDPEVRRVLQDHAARDPRVRVVFRETNGHISHATNSAIEIARGAYIALLDHDDLLDPDALLLVARVIDTHPDAKIIYTDEDKIREDGTRYDPHFKPGWNRELLYGMNYISHLGVYDAVIVREVGMCRPGFEGAQDYDLLLRCVEQIDDSQIHHIAKVLYSWRATPGRTAMSNEAKPDAAEAGRRALEEHLARTMGKSIPVVAGPFPFSYRALWPIEGEPLVSIVMPTRDHLKVLRVAVETILEKTSYRNFELIIVDNGSVNPETLDWFAQVQKRDSRVRVLRDDSPFNYSALNNTAVAQSRGDIVALINNDVEVIAADWLSEMVALAQRSDVGCVGAKLYYPDGRIQHAGVVIGIGGVVGHSHLFYPGEGAGYFGRLKIRQNYSAVTAACLVVRREVFDTVGGLNETDLAVAFNDIDFCLKVRAAGYHNLWTPWAELYHHESISRGDDSSTENRERFKGEVSYMKTRWDASKFTDPAYNPNLTHDRNDFTLALPQWDI